MQRNKLPGLISGMVTCDKEINDMKDKYDVAVYGLWYGNNYGSIITYYALTRVLELHVCNDKKSTGERNRY